MSTYEYDTIEFQQSDLVERLLLELGTMLHGYLIEANRYDEVATVSEMIGEFTYMASHYGEQIEGVREDLGVDLNEAASFKLYEMKHPDAHSEWHIYAAQGKQALDELRARKKIK